MHKILFITIILIGFEIQDNWAMVPSIPNPLIPNPLGADLPVLHPNPMKSSKPDPMPKKCSAGSPCKHDYEDDDYEDHPDCGESDYGTSVCEPDGYKLFYFFIILRIIKTLIIFKGQFEANIL